MKRGFLKSKLLSPGSEQDGSAVQKEKLVEGIPSEVSGSEVEPCVDDSKHMIQDLHALPASLVAKAGKRRFVCCEWPRNPEGPTIYATPEGKRAPNGLRLWGATLYDFYYVRRVPKVPAALTLSTGSKLAAHMRAIGELDWAKDEIYSASQEQDPVQVHPYDIGELIKDRESLIRKGTCGKPVKRLNAEEPIRHTAASEDASQSLISLFEMSNYPYPWPLVPFSTPAITLQKRIPYHLLPQKLVVHDPWNLLFVDETNIRKRGEDMEWTSKKDIVRTYCLQLSPTGKEMVEKEIKSRAELDAKCKDIDQREGYLIDPECKTSPAIMIFPPLRPPPPESVPEAHLYLSPAHQVGTGNHSVVYNAEWELPRSLLVDDILCQMCMEEKVAEELGELQTSHSREKEWEAKEVSESVSWNNHLHTRTLIPLKEVFPRVSWQNLERGPHCPHIQESTRDEKVPPTVKVSVAVKLSKRFDAHLGREAKNYQSFPGHLFEHWSGYNIIQPLHDPVPVGAVLPQFYGYYVPEKNSDGDEEDEEEEPPYLSAILLLENCGIPIGPEALDKDDKNECASLLYRLHEAGWSHGSFAARNILMQHSPLSPWPTFRLIDFGRSARCNKNSRSFEERAIESLFHLGHFQGYYV